MKCGALIYRELRGKRHPKLKTLEIISKGLLARGHIPRESEDKYEVCDGNIKIKISLDDDSYCNCCSSPYISIKYECDKCGCNEPSIPLPYDQESLTLFVNSALDKME